MIDLVKKAAKAKDLDSINPIWSRTKKLDAQMSVHFSGEYPHLLFHTAAPNETEEIRKYKKAIYKAITKPPTGRALAATRRVWNPRNFTMPDLGDYMTKGYPGYGSLLNYFVQMFHKKKLEWANAVQVVRPRMIPVKKDTQDNVVVDASAPTEPIAIIIPAENVIDFNEDYVLVLLETRAPVVYGGQTRNTGRIYEYYTNQNITRYTETSQENVPEPSFDVQELFDEGGHGLEYIPAIKLKGVPVQSVEGRMIYESYFSPALPMLESALIDHSLLQLGKTHAYPHPWEMVDKCGNPRCAGGQIMGGRDETDQPIWEDCPTCGGSGRRNPGPLGNTQIQVRNNDGEVSPGIPLPPTGFESPDVQIYEFMRREIDTQIEQAFMMMQIDVSESRVRGDETALGKMIDLEELFSFLQTLANELFEAFVWTANSTGKMRERTWQDIQIKPPHDFQIRGQKDLLEEISDSSVPNIVRKDTIDEFITMRFASDETQLRINEIIRYSDGLYMLSPEDVRVHAMELKPEDKVLHFFILKYIEEFMEEKQGWINGNLAELEAQLRARAQRDIATGTTNFDINMNEQVDTNELGKIPLALQQLALAATRLDELGDATGATAVRGKMKELLDRI